MNILDSWESTLPLGFVWNQQILVRGCPGLVRRRREEPGTLAWWMWAGLMVSRVDYSLGNGDIWACRGNPRNSGLYLAKQKIPDFFLLLTGLAALGINTIIGSEYITNSHSCSTPVLKFYVEYEFYSKQILLKYSLIALIPNHIFFFFYYKINRILNTWTIWKHLKPISFSSYESNNGLRKDCALWFMTTCCRDSIVTLVSDV